MWCKDQDVSSHFWCNDPNRSLKDGSPGHLGISMGTGSIARRLEASGQIKRLRGIGKLLSGFWFCLCIFLAFFLEFELGSSYLFIFP